MTTGSIAAVVIVTGGSRGIGRAISTQLAKAGFAVMIACRSNLALAEQLTKEIQKTGGTAAPFAGDLTEFETARRMFREASRLGDLYGLVNNAGSTRNRPFALSNREEWWETFSGNVLPTVNTCRLAVPILAQQKRGVLLNITSIVGRRGSVGQTAYSAAKGAIAAFTKSLAREVGPFGVTVNALALGPVDTEMLQSLPTATVDAMKAASPLGRVASPHEIAEIVTFLAQNRTPFLHGEELVVDGGITMQ